MNFKSADNMEIMAKTINKCLEQFKSQHLICLGTRK